MEIFHRDISPGYFTDKTQSVIPEDRVIESLGQIESQQSVDLILTGEQDVREVRTIEDPFPMRLQKVASEIKHGTQAREEGKSRVQIEQGMAG